MRTVTAEIAQLKEQMLRVAADAEIGMALGGAVQFLACPRAKRFFSLDEINHSARVEKRNHQLRSLLSPASIIV